MENVYLAHHGVKGQKWGVRRYQNPDGTLTDEGRRRYGFGSEASKMITRNTKDRIKQGTKVGAKVGAALGVAGGVGSAAIAIAALSPYVAATSVAAYAGANFISSLVSGTASGAWNGVLIGSVIGVAETHKGRAYIERYDKGLDEFERRDQKSK